MVFVDLPADVRGHHPGADHRRRPRTGGSSARSCRSSRCGRSSSTARSRTGCSRAEAAGCSSSGALDFAGGTVVHINAGVAGLALAILLGRRRGWPRRADAAAQRAVRAARRRPAVVRLVRVQRRARRCGANQLAGYAFVNTNTATAAAAARPGSAWRSCATARPPRWAPRPARSPAWSRSPRAPGSSARSASIAVGAARRRRCARSRSRSRAGSAIDDSLDVVAVHLVGGILGSLCVGLFATVDTNPAGADGLFYGGGCEPARQAGAGGGLGDRVHLRDDHDHRAWSTW